MCPAAAIALQKLFHRQKVANAWAFNHLVVKMVRCTAHYPAHIWRYLFGIFGAAQDAL
jgi:hypothetical protein